MVAMAASSNATLNATSGSTPAARSGANNAVATTVATPNTNSAGSHRYLNLSNMKPPVYDPRFGRVPGVAIDEYGSWIAASFAHPQLPARTGSYPSHPIRGCA